MNRRSDLAGGVADWGGVGSVWGLGVLGGVWL